MSKTVLFQTIRFNISTQFSSIPPIDKTLSGATTPGYSVPRSNGSEGVLRIPPKHSWKHTIRLFSVISRILIVVSYPSEEMKSVYFTTPSDWDKKIIMGKGL